METSKANHIKILYSNNRKYTFLCIQIFDVKQQKMRRKKNIIFSEQSKDREK